MSKKLDRMKSQKAQAEQKLRYYQHQEKMLEHRIPELTSKARTHRLCTRGGMLESFLICPGELTDDQVMELLKLSFRQQEVVLALSKMIHEQLRSCRRLDETGLAFRPPSRFHPKENCIFLALLRSYPFAALAQGRSALRSIPGQRAQPNTIPNRSPRAILAGGFCFGGDTYSVSAFPNHHHPAQQGPVGGGRCRLPERRKVVF